MANDPRIRLDPDVADKFDELASKAGTPRDWLINHILRTIQNSIDVVLTIDLKQPAKQEIGQKTIIVKTPTQKKWSSKI